MRQGAVASPRGPSGVHSDLSQPLPRAYIYRIPNSRSQPTSSHWHATPRAPGCAYSYRTQYTHLYVHKDKRSRRARACETERVSESERDPSVRLRTCE